MSNHPMISPTISDLSETLYTASPLLVYCIQKVTAHFIGYFSRNSISNFQKFLKKFQNRTFLKFVPSKHFLITILVNVQSTWKLILARLNIVEHEAINFSLIWVYLLGEILS